MRSFACLFDDAAVLNLIRADVLVPIWLDSISKRNMPDIRSASDTELGVSGTITLHLCMGVWRTRVSLSVVKDLVVSVFIVAMYIDGFIELIHPPERTMVSYHYPPQPMLFVHETWRELKKDNTEVW